MIISPPFLPRQGESTSHGENDSAMAVAEEMEQLHGIYPITFDRRFHCGIHLMPSIQNEPVRAIADGEVVAYRVSQRPILDQSTDKAHTNNGFVLLKHKADTGDGRVITFYSLYMHLLDIKAQNNIGTMYAPAPAQQRPDSTPDQLPAWLLSVTPGHAEGAVVPGNGRKVYRKDMLGLPGSSHGISQLHVEIFMAEGDFTSYFGSGKTRLGERTPKTPVGDDVWGHTYYVIPGGSSFHRMPTSYGNVTNGTGEVPKKAALNAANYPPLEQGKLDAKHTLYAEVYFHRGERYTRAWLDKGNGVPIPLNEGKADVDTKEYEYKLYERACEYYRACPSEGYELLRYGRILSSGGAGKPPIKLPEAARATWVNVRFSDEARGYIDINQSGIQKLSDADFPRMAGWQKIAPGNTPFGVDNRCSYQALLNFTGDGSDPLKAWRIPVESLSQDDQVYTCMRREKDVRRALSGFICHSVSEWDGSQNEQRYKDLNEPGGFFHQRKADTPNGYQDFLGYLKKLQFMEASGFKAGQKFWFFHPLKFIRHFRRCGWLSERELVGVFPQEAIRYHKPKNQPGYWVSEKVDPIIGGRMRELSRTQTELNKAMQKFGIASSPRRMSAFLGNALQEIQWFDKLHENNLSAKYAPWDGRGFLQLTWPGNYIKYWSFLGRSVPDALKTELEAAHRKADKEDNNEYLKDSNFPKLTAAIRQWREDVEGTPFDAAQSAGAYWSWSGAARYADNITQFIRSSQPILQPRNASGLYYANESFLKVAATVNLGSAQKAANGSVRVKGIEARYQAYASASIILVDRLNFPDANREIKDLTEGYQRRKIP